MYSTVISARGSAVPLGQISQNSAGRIGANGDGVGTAGIGAGVGAG